MTDILSCVIKPKLTMKPGSIPGPGGDVNLSFHVTSEACTQLKAHYQILGESAYRFTSAGSGGRGRVPTEIAAPSKVVEILHAVSKSKPARDYFSGDLTIRRQGPATAGEGEAALKIVVRVWGSGLPGSIVEPVIAVGSIAVLSGGLRKLMEDQFGAQEMKRLQPGTEAFRKKVLEFIKLKKQDPELQKKLGPGFKWPGNDTIMNALMGDTESIRTTVEKLGPGFDDLREQMTETLLGNKDFKGKIKAFQKFLS